VRLFLNEGRSTSQLTRPTASGPFSGESLPYLEFVLLASAFRRYRFPQQEWEEWAEAADKRALVVPAEQRGGRWRMGQVTSDVVNLREPLLRLETYTCEHMTGRPPGP
jgi:hypothetical protein